MGEHPSFRRRPESREACLNRGGHHNDANVSGFRPAPEPPMLVATSTTADESEGPVSP